MGASRGGSFLVGRDVSAGDGGPTYSFGGEATQPRGGTGYDRGVYNPPDNWQLRYALSQEYVCTPSPALTSLTLWQNVWGDVCAPVAGAYVLLCCGKM